MARARRQRCLNGVQEVEQAVLECPWPLSRSTAREYRQVRGILFDLDGTLLDIDLTSFLARYFEALAGVISPLVGDATRVDHAMRAVGTATDAMMRPHPGQTNREVFNVEFERCTAIRLDDHEDVFDRFYAEEFPKLGDGYGPMPGAVRAIEAARELGLKVALATNPIFPRAAVDHRVTWAGLDGASFEAVTSYEWMYACKPYGAYFRQTAEALGLDPSECLMVGDDPALDLPAADTGMRTYYVGCSRDTSATYQGGLDDLADLLPRLAR